MIERNRHRNLRSRSLNVQLAGQNAHVLVAASREVHHQYVMGGQRGSKAQGLGHGVGAFERGKNAFSARERDDCVEGGGIVLRDVLGAAGVVKRGVLGADGGVVEARRDGMGERDLAVLILQDVGEGSLQDAGRAALEAGCVLAESGSAAAGFDADEADLAVGDELVERADGVGSAADAGDDGGGQAAFLLEDLLASSRC